MSIVYRIPRFLCPALARTVKTHRSSSSPRTPPLVQNIAKLEAYIKDLRKDVRKRAHRAKAVQDQSVVDEKEIEEVYASLDSQPAPALPPPKALLSQSLMSRLAIDPHASVADVNWHDVVSTLLASGSLASLSTRELNSMLSAMPHGTRSLQGPLLLNALGKKADRLTYDLIMDSHASMAKAKETMEVYDAARSVGLKPTLYSYAHLMKAFAVTKDLQKALALYRHIQDEGLEPNLVINTSLITTLLRNGKVDLAFASFDGLKYKSAESAPDAQLYSLMIHACSQDSKLSAERASDLFTEMTERGLKPTLQTFNALIHVYAQRKDYFTEAWRLSESMQRNNIEMDKTTWHSLLTACVTNRDILKARNLVREMMKIGSRFKQWQPDAITYQLLFRAYANARVRRSGKSPANVLESSAELQRPAQESSLWVDEEPFDSDALLRESANVMTFLQESRRHLLGTQLIDTYMTIAPNFEAGERLSRDWDEMYVDHKKGRYSYQIALSACYRLKDWQLLQRVWIERQTWRKNMTSMDGPVTGPLAMPHDQYGDFEAIKTYIEALSRLNRIQQATDVLSEARKRHTFEKRDLRCFQTKSIQVGDEEAVLLYRDMFPDESKHDRDGRYRGHYY